MVTVDGVESNMGKFKTARAADDASPVSLVWFADMAG